ncbi:MAG: outer membrane protein assembly factor BamC [Betaproteobacteria bacterium]|nr:outer membrane protein assembly factor BamC [Betaproteobacteria bacterium]
MRAARSAARCRRLGLLAILGAAFAIGGCSTVDNLTHGKAIDYKSAGTLPPLEIPPDLTAPTPNDRYEVPSPGGTTLSGYQAEHKEQAAQIGNGDVLPKVAHMHIVRDGTERWLVVDNETPEQLWPQIKDFWQQNGFLIKTEIPSAGVMETDWAENRAKIPQDFIRRTLGKLVDQLYSTSERDKFRTRLEPTAGGKGTDVYITHRGMQEVYVGNTNVDQPLSETRWEPRPSDPGLEAEFLRRLMVRLGASQEKAKEMIAAAPEKARAEMKQMPDGGEMIEVLEPFDRAWRRVGIALDRVGFTVQDQNREKGLYYVRYADPEAGIEKSKGGLLSHLAFWRSSPDKGKPEQYQVQVKQVADNSQVLVLNDRGVADRSETARKILALLHDQLK